MARTRLFRLISLFSTITAVASMECQSLTQRDCDAAKIYIEPNVGCQEVNITECENNYGTFVTGGGICGICDTCIVRVEHGQKCNITLFGLTYMCQLPTICSRPAHGICVHPEECRREGCARIHFGHVFPGYGEGPHDFGERRCRHRRFILPFIFGQFHRPWRRHHHHSTLPGVSSPSPATTTSSSISQTTPIEVSTDAGTTEQSTGNLPGQTNAATMEVTTMEIATTETPTTIVAATTSQTATTSETATPTQAETITQSPTSASITTTG